MKYDYLIVGSGFFGATFARKMTDAGKKCLVIDKNHHVAGAAFDQKREGILVSEYGAHILHTHSEEIWSFLNRFSPIDPFINKPKVLSGGKVYSFPINMMTLHQLWGVVTPEEAREKLNLHRIPCSSPKNFEEWVLDKVGKEIYEKFIYGYTKKQWLKEPRELPSSIIARLPIRLTYDENYFTTKYQGIPRHGYTALVQNMLDGIDVELGVDFFAKMQNWQNIAKHLVYTGPVDKFFDYSHGELEYNTLRFEHKVYKGDFQGNAVFNYTDLDVPYIRTIEHKHFYETCTPKHYVHDQKNEEVTVVSYDFPVPFKEHPEPYYPIRDERNSDLYTKYYNIKKDFYKNVTFGGRLGEYKYLDIDQTVASAYTKAERMLSE
jgi:UDP-galactopyranose mutase